MMSAILNGTFVCMPAYDTETALTLIGQEKITSLFLVPTMFHDIVHRTDLAAFDLGSVNNIAYAGMSMTTALVESCAKTFPQAAFSSFYGSSEIYTFAVRNDLAENPGSAGRAGIGQTLRVVRADSDERVGPDEIVPVGETGEIIASMNALDAFSGYWKRPDADEKAIRDGWYFTGDLGKFDENGEIYVLGRVDDMIISGGENIYAEEVEDVLAKSPDVLGVAVIGIEDDRWGTCHGVHRAGDRERRARNARCPLPRQRPRPLQATARLCFREGDPAFRVRQTFAPPLKDLRLRTTYRLRKYNLRIL